MSAGELVPDALTINMLSQELEKKSDDHGFILDGFPRNVVQADALSELLDRKDLSIDVVLFFNVPNDELVRRLSTRYTCTVCQAPHNVDQTKSTPTSKCNLDRTKLAFVECEGELYQRSDDAPEAIKRRLDVYDEETKPILNYYEEQNLLLPPLGMESQTTYLATSRTSLITSITLPLAKSPIGCPPTSISASTQSDTSNLSNS